MNGVRTFGALTATPQPFEEALLAAPVWRVTAAGAVRPEDLSILVDAAHARGVGLIACRLPEGDPAVEALAAAGFRTVETLLTFEGTIRDDAAMPGNIRPARIGDVAACREIATATFRHDRFHADPAIDDAVAAALKAQQIENSIRGRADTVLVVETDGQVGGFNACMLVEDAAVIDLIGVCPRSQGRGLGRALVEGALATYAGRRSVLRVGTQESNLPSRKLYRRFGLEIVRRQVTLHRTGAGIRPS